jgi:vacuolar protein sorting-associated protein 54
MFLTQLRAAISTVLNNPRTKPNPLKASKAPQPPVHSPELKRIRRKDFDPYLKTIGPAWQRFEQSRKEALNPTQAFGTPISQLSPNSEDQPTLSTSSVSLDPTRANGALRSSLAPLSSVPSIYFNPSFDLSDPRAFATVTEQDTGASHRRTTSSPTDITLNHILQEKMSHYMDVVEQHLVREIAIRSVPFFAALSNLQDLQTEGAACLSRIARLKTQLYEVDTCQAQRGLQVIHLQTKRDNLAQLQSVVRNVREVAEMVAMAKHLEDEGDHFEALGLTESIEALLKHKEPAPLDTQPTPSQLPSRHTIQDGSDVFSLPTVIESPDAPTHAFPRNDFAPSDSRNDLVPAPTVDLTSLVSLSELPSKLSSFKTNISVALQRDFLAVLTEDLVNQTANLEHGVAPAPSSNTVRSEAWTAQLRVLIDGLLRTGGVERAFTGYKEVAVAQIKMLVQAHQISAGNLSKQELESSGEDDMEFVKGMQHDEFMRLMRSLYATLLKSIQTTQEHGSLIQKDIEDIHRCVSRAFTEPRLKCFMQGKPNTFHIR